MAALVQWEFSGYIFPYIDSPTKRGAGDWNKEEKVVQHDPLNANISTLTSWGFKSRTRTITGECGVTTRDTINAKWEALEVGGLTDSEGRKITCRITAAKFDTQLPKMANQAGDCATNDGRYKYTISFMER